MEKQEEIERLENEIDKLLASDLEPDKMDKILIKLNSKLIDKYYEIGKIA